MTPLEDRERRQTVDRLIEQATALRWIDYDQVQVIAEKAFELACQMDIEGRQYQHGMAVSLSLLAQRNCAVGNWSTALSEASQAIALLADSDPTTTLGWLHEVIGWTRYFMGDYVAALDHLRQALRIAEITGDPKLETYSLDRIASVQGSAGQLDISLETHQRALAMHRQHGDKLGEALVLNNMTYTYMDLGDLDSALTSAELSLRLTQEVGSVYLLMGVYDTLSEVSLRMGLLDAAEKYSRAGLELAHEREAEPDVGDALLSLGRVELARGEIDLAIEHASGALEIAERLGRSVEEFYCHQLLAEIHERCGNLEFALWHFRRFHELENVRHTEENESRLAQLKVEYQVESARKDAEILRLRSLALEREVEQRRVAQASLEAAASLDPLTGLYNRRHMPIIAEELQHAIEQHLPVSLAMFDVDRFKEVNDDHGHAAGDRVLMVVAEELRRNARRSDMPCRWGGDEFMMLLVGMDRQAATRTAERLRAAVAATPVGYDGTAVPVTLSAGVASIEPGSPIDLDGLLNRADRALYDAKEAGRNRVVLSEQ